MEKGGRLVTFPSYCETEPFSCPAMMYFDKKLKPAKVALLSSQVIVMTGSSSCSASTSHLTL